MKMKKNQLKNMKMPEAHRPEEDYLSELDSMSADEGPDSEEADETTSDDESAEVAHEASSELPSLDTFSDEDLLAEIRKRGLAQELTGEENMSAEEPAAR